MSDREAKTTAINVLSYLFIAWFIAWVVALLILSRESYTPLFFILGIAPVAGWFLIKPRRIVWFLVALFGIRGLDD